MRLILTHKSRNLQEIVDIFDKSGTYCCPDLPHYRYRSVQDHCRTLKRLGLIEKSGVTDVGINYRRTTHFREWQHQRDSGLTKLGVVKWRKQCRASDPTPTRGQPNHASLLLVWRTHWRNCLVRGSLQRLGSATSRSEL